MLVNRMTKSAGHMVLVNWKKINPSADVSAAFIIHKLVSPAKKISPNIVDS